jgi:hypothetical protein
VVLNQIKFNSKKKFNSIQTCTTKREEKGTVRRCDKFLIKIGWNKFNKCSRLAIMLLKTGASLSMGRS